MKIINYILICILLAISGNNFAQSEAFSAEEQEIIEVIKEETRCFLNRDFEEWATHWFHEPYCRHYLLANSFYNVKDGWNAMVRHYEKHFQGDPMDNFDIQKDDFEITILGDIALAHYSEKYISTDSNGKVSEGFGKNNAVLKKERGIWKFLTMNIAYLSTYDDAK